jgi:nucleoside-diphosphate-sugar epimerase
MLKSVLVTGGTGFLGCHLARQLLKEGYTVTLFDLAELDAKDLFGKVTVINGDIRDKDAITKAMEKQQFVIHAAAALPIQLSKDHIFSTNVDGTNNVLEAALKHGVKRLVFISTTAVYGVPKHLPEKEDAPLDPIGYYGQSKIAGENLCKKYMKKGLEINIIRPKTFVGPERLGVFELWYEAIYTGKRVYILGKGNNPYQLLAVSDVVSAIILALTSKTKNEIFNIGAKDFQSWKKDLQFVIQYAKSKSRITGLPVIPSQVILFALENLHLSPIAAWHYKTMPVQSYVSTVKAEKLLHWQAKKSNKELLLENYKWYEKNRDEIIGRVGNTHRVGWNFKILNLVKIFG